MNYNIQTLSSVKTLTLVTLEQAKRVAQSDSQSLSTNGGKYVTENTFSYYILLNVWGHQVFSYASEEAWVYIWLRVQQCGLISVIRDTSNLADLIIHGEAPDWDYTYGYLSVMANFDYSQSDERLVQLLTILRFPKRFSPRCADIILAQSLTNFLELNSYVKDSSLTEPSWFWLKKVRDTIHLMLKDFSFSKQDGYFSAGTTATTSKLLATKLVAYSELEPCIAELPQYQLSSAPAIYARWRETSRLRDGVIAQSVPKSYKTARIIAKEPPVSAFFLQAIASGMRETIIKNGFSTLVDVEDQETSQELCRLGSLDGKYATIDLTSASDTISESLARSVLPANVVHATDEYRCAYIYAGKEKRVMRMFATSGSPLTFIVESIIFAAIAKVTTDFVGLLTHSRMLPPRVYGDDIIIDDRACTLCVEVLTEMGCIPNLSKTFSGRSSLGYYRESCGAEYLNGNPMHHCYYPRKPIMASPEGLAAVCELQHKLYGNWKIRMFLVQVVKTLEPRMTCHPFGSKCDDLWDNIPTGIKTYYRGVDSPYAERAKYLSLKAKYPTCTLTSQVLELLDMWYYYSYLKSGPLYEDDLSRLLHVSVSRKRYAADSYKAANSWGYRVE